MDIGRDLIVAVIIGVEVGHWIKEGYHMLNMQPDVPVEHPSASLREKHPSRHAEDRYDDYYRSQRKYHQASTLYRDITNIFTPSVFGSSLGGLLSSVWLTRLKILLQIARGVMWRGVLRLERCGERE